MSLTDKAKNKAQQMAGAAKEKYGDSTDNEQMRAEGARQQSGAQSKQAAEKAKDAGRNVKDAFNK
ncbi:CsbD-like protein [Micromonospora pisi]|uniref:CsbD-like protein n=1 Tax=Micromonospora pisi TaxID=589240 RepID=A0A495JXV5_9ACTN|nr:CsbD family protein [Micromonospora pisi]RKR93094.1 CsbD-like protein [Micromonospora pisi]